MPTFSRFETGVERYERRKAKKAYWMNKGCSKRKADELIYRYGY